jgi:hypothetical protein
VFHGLVGSGATARFLVLFFKSSQDIPDDFGLCGSTLFRDTRDQSFKSSRQANACPHGTLSYDYVGHRYMTKPLELQEALDALSLHSLILSNWLIKLVD